MESAFAMVCCQQGAELAVKREVAAPWRLAFSRPGFITFKSDTQGAVELPRGVFVRHCAWSIGRVAEASSQRGTEKLLELIGDRRFDQLHLWQRDRAPVGKFSFEPGVTVLAETVAEHLFTALKRAGSVKGPVANHPGEPGDTVLDVVLVEPDQWMVGMHRVLAGDPSTSWPGGTPKIIQPASIVSRTYLKTAEGLSWAEFPMRPGDQVVEVGSAPGGSVQRLLELGMHVTGIDPAEMDPEVAAHPHFTHLKARGGDLKRKIFQNCKWLIVDSNVRPDKTLTTVGNIVTNASVKIRGMLVTLKLTDYEMAERIPEWIGMIRGWGFEEVRVRQLAFGKTEVCVAARVTSVSKAIR